MEYYLQDKLGMVTKIDDSSSINMRIVLIGKKYNDQINHL